VQIGSKANQKRELTGGLDSQEEEGNAKSMGGQGEEQMEYDP